MADETRPPSATAMAWNSILREYTVLAPVRMNRKEGTNECPFCADVARGLVPPGARAWIRPNDFPALRPPDGECVILIYSREHERTFADLVPEDALAVAGLWRRVYDDLSPRYPCVMTWETSGEVIGQTQRHPHGQTYGIAIVPELLAREMRAVEECSARGEGCPFCAEVAREANGPRVVFAGEHWLAYIPPYARYPYQVQVLPRAHFPNVTGFASDGAAARELMDALQRIVRAYNAAFEAPMPYMLALHQLADARFHFHVELLPVGRAPGKLKLAASAESAFGLWLNDALPEAKAAELRALLARDTGNSGGA